MAKVYELNGTVLNLTYLDKVRSWMEEQAAKEYNFSYTRTKLTNVEYDETNNHYKFTLEFINAD